MRKTLQAALIAAITCAGCAIQTAHSAPATDGAPPSAPATPATLCQPGEVVIFSCRVRGNGKIASLCGAGDFGKNPDAHAYYAFGRPDAIELRYPEVPAPARERFMRTPLFSPGATGVFVYSFANAGFRYSIFSISGTRLESQGVLVTLSDDRRVLADLPCVDDVIQTHEEDAYMATWEWPGDDRIRSWGLPRK